MLKTIADIRAAHEAIGGFFFTPRNVRFANSLTLRNVYQVSDTRALFITSEQPEGQLRRWTVHSCDKGRIRRVSEYGEFAGPESAKSWARERAADERAPVPNWARPFANRGAEQAALCDIPDCQTELCTAWRALTDEQRKELQRP